MAQKIYLMTIIALLLPAAGCFFYSGNSGSIKEYDLGSIRSGAVSDIPVEFGSIINISGTGTGMAIREADGSLIIDDACRYTVLPEQMLLRKLIEIFPAAGEKKLRISGNVLRFEIDRRSLSAVFSADFQLRINGKSESALIRTETTLKDNTPAGAAESMERSLIAAGKKLADIAAGLSSRGAKK